LPPPASALAPITATPLARPDNVLRGILLLVSATIMFSVSDVTAKAVSATLPVVEVAWVRYCVFVLLTVVPALGHGSRALATRMPGQQVLRGVAVLASALLFILGLQRMPIADAAAINFVAPLFITILSVPLLGEQVGARRWVAVGVGLLGAVIAAQPGTSAFQPAAAFPVLSALAWAVAIIWTRKLSVTDRPGTTIAWTAGSGLVLLTAMLPFVARLPSWPEFAACLLIGVAASAGQSLVVLAYRHAPASVLAPFSYLQLIWSTLFGIIVFAADPGPATILGAAVIAASGLYAASQERKRAPRR
jgi:drug/metabolite transporter (DMT)-like permease